MSPSPTDSRVSRILSIIAAWRYRSATTRDQFQEFVPDLKKQLLETVAHGDTVRFILTVPQLKAPAAGDRWKSLEALPDKAEELALQTLNGFAESIAEIYEGGATVTIVVDEPVYGDTSRIQDTKLITYYEELIKLASLLALSHLKFARPCALVGNTAQQLEYSDYRPTKSALPDGSLALTHFPELNESERPTKKHHSMAHTKVDHLSAESAIHLSVHESNNLGKISLDLFPPSTNPDFLPFWHGTVAVFADASVRIVDTSTIDMANFVVIKNHEDRPWLLREKSNLFSWPGMKLDFEPLFPCGMLVRPRHGDSHYNFEDVDMKLVRQLALSTAPLLLRGFTMEVDKEVFRRKARELGKIQTWPFGDILEVRENVDLSVMNVLTREAMPFHYDGCFKTVHDDETGEWVPAPPLFQMFRNVAASQSKGGLTLFASSRNLIPLLDPDILKLEELHKLKWKTYTPDKEAYHSHELRRPFIITHPESGLETFRFHEPWPKTKCVPGSGAIVQVKIWHWPQNDSNALCEKLTELMYDRRVAYRHQWKAGDLIFNDNFMTHHTRTAFEKGHREHWRIHVN